MTCCASTRVPCIPRASSGATGLDQLRMGRLGARPARPLLFHHVRRTTATARGVRAMGPVLGGGRPRDAVRMMAGTSVWSRVRALLRRNRAEGDLRDERDFHLEMQARKLARPASAK